VSAQKLVPARDANILSTAQALGMRLKRAGVAEHVGACPRCGGRDRFSRNTRKGVFNCRGCGVGGDSIELVRHVTGYEFGAAVAFIGDERYRCTSRPPAPEPPRWAHDLVARIVAEIVPIAGTPGEAYLRDVRHIDTLALADVIERTDVIGWNPSVYFNEPGHKLHGQRLGCVIAKMTDAKTATATRAISRTYIHNGRKIGKAKTLGAPTGVVRLTLDEDVLEGLHLAEGLESSLAAMAIGFRPMWSTGSTSLLAKFPILGGIAALTIFADHDESGAGEKAAREAEARWSAAGRQVRILRLKELGDLNDATMRASA
jgi:putative DNA primase/helicase